MSRELVPAKIGCRLAPFSLPHIGIYTYHTVPFLSRRFPVHFLNMRIIDFHTHAFPDELAVRAVPALEAEADIKAVLDGTVSSLLASMDRAGIERSVVASIATKPAQFEPILEWSRKIAASSGGRFVPFPSVHPKDPDSAEHVNAVARAGFRGIKLHSYYQGFRVDEKAADPLLRSIAEAGLVLLLHTGFDIAFPHDRLADPVRICSILRRYPHLKLVTSHFGAWKDWDEAERYILGRPIYMDISASIEFMGFERARRFLLEHPAEYLLFGSDSPWDDQASLIERVLAMDLPEHRLELLFTGNADRLLNEF